MLPGNTKILNELSEEWSLVLPPSITEEQLINLLGTRINELIKTDMSRLVSILYRIDVSETRIREMLLANKGTDAGLIIAHLVLERQKQKIKTRNMFNTRVDDISDEEKW